MIPLSLTLRNFMSYGDEPQNLDFSGMHVVCLSGDNGNGKSALLDAISYSLWGKTRATGSQAAGEDDLVRLGSEELEVKFQFLLGHDRYRVIRKRNKRTRSGDWQVHLLSTPERNQELDLDSETWIPVGGSSVRETERHLARLLRMEYETFLNSAYFQQGHADEFTRQKPDARKRILADILDLSRYDRLEEMARDRRGDCDLAVKDLEGEIRHLEARACEEVSHREALARHEETLAQWTAERVAREARLTTIRAELAALSEKETGLREREERLREIQAEVEEYAAQVTRLSERLQQEETLIAKADSIVSDHETLQETRLLVEQLDKEIGKVIEARESLALERAALDSRKNELRGEISRCEHEWETAEERARRIQQLDVKIAATAPRVAAIKKAKEEQLRIQTELAPAAKAFTQLSAQNKRFTAEIDETKRALALLEEVKAACPVCETSLSGDRQRAVVARLREKKAGLESSLRETNREGVVAKKKRDDLASALDNLNSKLAEAAAIEAQKQEMEQMRKELVDRNTGVAELAERLKGLRIKLETESYGADEKKRIGVLEALIAHLQDTVARHTAAKEIIRELTARQTETLYARLRESERNHANLKRDLEELGEKREKRRTQVESETARILTLRGELGGLDAVKEQASRMEIECQESTREADAARSQVERSRKALEDCAVAREQCDRKTAEREKVVIDRQAYTDLAASFGKKGVQALIIDNALPEIQDEANRLLARMTDNQMQVALSTIRTARSGSGQIETLDITITDDAGIRPYEMYSGGEAFRVNFAIRIALSRLLARRAGARLQTLIIDEGFGTQDAKGRERLVESIESIQDEFALILIITHLEDFKDAFPTRLEIVKSTTGSQISFVD